MYQCYCFDDLPTMLFVQSLVFLSFDFKTVSKDAIVCLPRYHRWIFRAIVAFCLWRFADFTLYEYPIFCITFWHDLKWQQQQISKQMPYTQMKVLIFRACYCYVQVNAGISITITHFYLWEIYLLILLILGRICGISTFTNFEMN